MMGREEKKMTKHRTFKAVGFFIVLAAVLAFLAIPKGEAGAGKRHIRWKAAVEPIVGTNLTGPPGDFTGGVDQVNINNGSGTCEISGDRYYFLELQLFAPSLQFSGMGDFSSWGDPVPPPYGFPKIATDWPYCVADFLNYDLINFNVHPTADYEHIILRFSTCGCEGSPTDLMGMGVGDILPVRMSFLFFSHIWGCPPHSPFTQKTFLNLLMNAHGYNKGTLDSNGSPFDIYIKRTSETEWVASVDTIFDNPGFQELPDSTLWSWPSATSDYILGQYATCASTKKGNRTIWTTTYHYPWAKAPLKFQIKFSQY